jgi:nicotinamidase-related amidase
VELPPLDLHRSALIVWDLQAGIAARAYNREDLVRNVRSLCEAYRAARLPVIYSQHTGLPSPWQNPSTARVMQRVGIDPRRGPYLLPGSAEWMILDEVAPREGDLILPKHTPSFFVGTPLEAMLRNRLVDTLVLTGVSAEGGITTTARHASALGFHPVIVQDAVGGREASATALALEMLRSSFDVEPTQAILERVRGVTPAPGH